MNFHYEDDKINVGELSVKGNSLYFGSYIVNIKNVATFEVGEIKAKIPYLFYIILILLLLLFITLLPIISFVLLVVLAISGYNTYNKLTDHKFYLTIDLNNNKAFKIVIHDKKFVYEIRNKLILSMNDEGGNYTVNIDKSKIISNDNHLENNNSNNHVENNNSNNDNHIEKNDNSSNDNHSVYVGKSINGNNKFNSDNSSLNKYYDGIVDGIKDSGINLNLSNNKSLALSSLNKAAKSKNKSKIKEILNRFSDVFTKEFILSIFTSSISKFLLGLIN